MRWKSGCRSRSGAASAPEDRGSALLPPRRRYVAASIPGIAFAQLRDCTIQRARSESLHAFASHGLLTLIGSRDHRMERGEIAAFMLAPGPAAANEAMAADDNGVWPAGCGVAHWRCERSIFSLGRRPATLPQR